MSGYTEAQLNALRAAAASGTLRVTYDGKTVEYRSQKEILQMIGRIERSVSGAARVTHYQPTFQRGT